MKHGLSSVVPSVVVVRYRDDYRRAGMVSAPICTANPNRVHASSATAEARGAQSHVMCIDDLPIGRRAFVAGDSERALNRGWHVDVVRDFHFGRPGRHRYTPSDLPRGPDVFVAHASR